MYTTPQEHFRDAYNTFICNNNWRLPRTARISYDLYLSLQRDVREGQIEDEELGTMIYVVPDKRLHHWEISFGFIDDN